MADADADLALTAVVVEALGDLGCKPILVGGMALVLLGSQRVTADFDFVIAHPREHLEDTIGVFYERGFELVSKLNDAGEAIATIVNRNVATIRLRLDAPDSAFFFSRTRALRIDLFFDFPIKAAVLAEHATRVKVASHVFHIASEADLLRMKRMAAADRSFPGDAQDIAFLEARRKQPHRRRRHF